MPGEGSPSRWRRRDPARDGQLVANWVDVFTALVCAGELPERWPQTLLVDSMNFRVRTGERSGRGFHVFAAMGCDPGQAGRWAPVPRLWRLQPFGTAIRPPGRLSSAPLRRAAGDRQRRRSCSACAIDAVFGHTVEHRLCEWHLGRKLREHLPEAILDDRDHPITRALAGAFHTPQAWSALVQAIEHEHAAGQHSPLTLAVRWLETYGLRVKMQIATRDPNRPNAPGPVEKVLREIDRRLGDRIGSFTNRARMANLLALMMLDIRGSANARDWSDQIRERLYFAGGRPARHRPTMTPRGSTRSSPEPLWLYPS